MIYQMWVSDYWMEYDIDLVEGIDLDNPVNFEDDNSTDFPALSGSY